MSFSRRKSSWTRLPPVKRRCTVYELDILLSWNCRYIAKAFLQGRLRRLADAAGYTLPVICTPEELLDNADEYND